MNPAEILERHRALDSSLRDIGEAINRNDIIPDNGAHSYLFALAQERNIQARTALGEATTAAIQFANQLANQLENYVFKIKDNGDIKTEAEARAQDHGSNHPTPSDRARAEPPLQLVVRPGRLVQVDQ